MRIVTPTTTYRHLGGLDLETTFKTNEVGLHIIVLGNQTRNVSVLQSLPDTPLSNQDSSAENSSAENNDLPNDDLLENQTLSPPGLAPNTFLNESNDSVERAISTPPIPDSRLFRDLQIRDKNGRGVTRKVELLNERTLTADVEFTPGKAGVERIRMRDVVKAEVASIDFDEVNLDRQELKRAFKDRDVRNAFYIDTSATQFSDGQMLLTASGEELWKCKKWDAVGEMCTGTWTKVQDLTAGEEYSIDIFPGDPAFIETGVATINTRKPVYAPNEPAKIVAVVLDRGGYLVSGANVSIQVTSPGGSTSLYSTAAGSVNETSRGIYEVTHLSTSEQGEYTMYVEAKAPGADQSMLSTFQVSATYPYDIIRATPVTFDPWAGPFLDEINISPVLYSEYYSYTESIPSDYQILDAFEGSVEQVGDRYEITWHNLTGNSTVQALLQAPLVSPDLHEFGKSFVTTANTTFYEDRPWYVAVDPYSEWLVEGGTAQFGSTETEIDVPLTRPITDLSRSFILTASSGDSGSRNGKFDATGYILNTTHIRFNRDTSGDTPTVSYYVIENTGGDIFVQRGEITVGSGATSNTGSISTSVDTSRSFITSSTRNDAGSRNQINEGYGTVELTDGSTVLCERAVIGSVMTCRYEVVESRIQTLTVQTDEVTLSGTSTSDTLPSSVDMSRSLLLFSHDASANGLNQIAVAGQLSSSTQLNFYHYSGTYTNRIRWYVIQFPSGASVQRNRIYGTVDTVLVETPGLSPSVIANRTFAFVSSTSNGGGTAFPRHRWINYLNASQLTIERFYNGQEYDLEWQTIQLPDPNLIPNVTLDYPDNGTLIDDSSVDFLFTAVDDSNYVKNCTLYTNETGSWAPRKSVINAQNNTQTNITWNLVDGSYTWNILCEDYYGSKAWAPQNHTFTLAAVAEVLINDVEGDTTTPFSFTQQSPTINITIVNRNADCYLSDVDQSYAQMVGAGKDDCGSFTLGSWKTCTYTGTLPIGDGYLYVACNTTNGIASNASNNKDVDIDVLCDSHTDCPSTQYCDYNQNCAPDIIAGYNCYNLGYGLGVQDAVCGNGTNSLCVNDSSYSFTGWYCTGDENDCVYNDNGHSFDLDEVLCISGTNDYRSCGASNTWNSLVDCGDSTDGANQSATTHSGEYCGYFLFPQTCVNGSSGGCFGDSVGCSGHIYNQTTTSCGSALADCDIGCGAGCDTTNSTSPIILNNLCYFDQSCSAACSWSQSTEIAPDFCINDNDGGACAFDNRTDPTTSATCYWTPTCANSVGAGLSSGSLNNLRANYCDYCNATGNHSGGYAPAPNASCAASCADSGTIYYDSGGTFGDRTDDCAVGVSSIISDSLTIGDIWNGTAPATCDNAECNADCGTLVGACLLGVCGCTDYDFPIITLLNPSPGYWSSSTSIDFKYNVTDISSGVENCSLLINGTIYQTNSSINKTLSEQLFTQTLSQGSYNWAIRCYDNGSLYNMNETSARAVGVDLVNPTISNPNKNETTLKINAPICLNVTASDALSGINRVYALIKYPGGTTEVDLYDDVATSCDPSIGDGIYSVEYEVPLSGDYNWTYAYAVDKAGNTVNMSVDLFWNVTEGGFLLSNLTYPTADLEINETGVNNNFTVTCNATCEEGFIDCTGVGIEMEYNNGSEWTALSNTTTDLTSDVASYDCGDLSAIQAPWWNSSFPYRRQMRVKTISSIAADHVIRVDFDTTGPNFRDDAEDLRIVFWNGSTNTEVDRQVFRPNETDSAIMFVIGNALAANSSNYFYYIYFGNDTATGAKNNQSNIWLFYDDFSDGTYTDDWGYAGGSASISMASSVNNPWTGGTGVMQVGSCDTSYIKVLTSSLAPIRDMASRILWMDNPGNVCGGGSPDADGVVGLHGSATTAYDGILVERDTDTGYHYDMGATGSLTGSQYYSPFNVWQWSEVRAYGTAPSGYQGRYWLFTESEPLSYSLTATTVTATSAGQPFARVASGTAYIAAIMIRPTVEFEPFTQIKDTDDASVPTTTSCEHTFTVTSGANSGNNTYPLRCVATSTNSQIDKSNEAINVTINDKPTPLFSYPANASWLANTEILNASASFDSDGSIVNYLFEYDDNAAFSSPSTICSSGQANCTWNTLLQSQCVNNSLSCYLRLTLTDDNGLSNSTYITIGFDTAGPVTTLDRARNFENITTNLFTINASSSDVIGNVSAVTFEYRPDDISSWIQICNDSSEPYECEWNLTLLTDGSTYELRAFANDSSSNIGLADTHANITLDRSGPLILLEGPSDGSYTEEPDVIFTYNVTDATSAVSSCSLYVDGILNKSNSSITEGQTLSFTTTLSEGIHDWNITCTDTLGNMNWSLTRNVTIDTIGPSATLLVPPNFATIHGVSTTTINATVNDVGIGNISVVTFEYRENTTETWKSACNDTDTSAPFSCLWDLSTLADGSNYEVRVRANDTLGNVGDWDTHVLITIDQNPPLVTLLAPPDGKTDGDGNLFFQYKVNDVGTTVSNCSLVWEGSINQTEPGSIVEDQVYLFNLTNVTDGNYTWTVNCTDAFGQVGTGGTRDLEVDIIYLMNVSVETNASEYQRGNQLVENANITTNVTDIFGGPLIVNTVTDIVDGNTTYRWWNASWDRRKEVTVTNNLGADRTIIADITVDTAALVMAGKLQSDCDDIRFTDLNGTPLDYYLNSACNTGSTSFLVELTLPSLGSENILMYYDNPSAVSNTTVAAPRSVIGESGAVSTSNFQWVLVKFSNTYTSTPVVLATTATQNAGTADDDSPLIPTINSINSTHMNITICQDNGAVTCDATVVSETLHYFVFDVEKSNSYSWMAVGTQNVTTAGADTSLSYGKTFSNVPALWLTPQTYNQGGNITAIAWTEDVATRGSSSGPVIGCVHQAPGSGTSVDNCESGQPSETFGFLALDISSADIDTLQTNNADISNSAWTAATFTPTYTNPRVMVTQNDDNGGQDPEYAMARSVTSSGMDFRYCEADAADVCNSHTGEVVNWFALEEGNITAPGVPDSNISISFGDEIEHVFQYNGMTDIAGFYSYVWNFSSREASLFTALSVGSKNKYADGFNYAWFTLLDDYEAPNVTLNTPGDGEEANSSVTFTYFVDDTLSSVENCTLYIDGVSDALDTQIEEGPTQFFYPRIPAGGPHHWWVVCYDAYGNRGVSQNWTVIIIPPDLMTDVGNITIDPSGPYIEGQQVMINATIYNIGGSDTIINFTTQLWDGDPEAGGSQIGNNFSFNLTDQFGVHMSDNVTWNWTIARPGPSTLYIVIDPPLASNGSIFEIYESNNKIPFNITTPGYVNIYGNVTAKIILESAQNETFRNFDFQTNNTGLIFFADAESSVTFSALQALGRSVANASATADFSDADTLLNMSSFNDSLNIVWAQGNNTPFQTQSFTVSDQVINAVPIVDSSISGAFKTGILWDTSDTGNAEYDVGDGEDLVFVTRINSSATGDYGVTDFQSKVPALLRNYNSSGGTTLYLYYELI